MLTARQKECLDFIRSYTALHGQAPLFAEIGAELGIAGMGAVHGLISRLEERGYVRRDPRRKRAIEVIHKPERLLYFKWNDEIKAFVAWSPLRKASGQG